MANIEWAVAQRIESPYGTVLLNQPDPITGRTFQVMPEGYKIVPSIRVIQDNNSQQDGSILHPRYTTGMVATMKVTFTIGDAYPDQAPACGQDLQEMYALLNGALNSIRDLEDANSNRVIWQPTGYGDERMLIDCELLSWPEPSIADLESGVTFSIESPYPYAIDKTPANTVIGGAGTITNAGNSALYPVIEVTASGAFTIINHSVTDLDGNPMGIWFNAGLPGGAPVPGGGAEINNLRGTIFAGGAGADLIASVDPQLSDFFWLKPGANNITVSGTTATFKFNNAWV